MIRLYNPTVHLLTSWASFYYKPSLMFIILAHCDMVNVPTVAVTLGDLPSVFSMPYWARCPGSRCWSILWFCG